VTTVQALDPRIDGLVKSRLYVKRDNRLCFSYMKRYENDSFSRAETLTSAVRHVIPLRAVDQREG
jgi:hypothetical protein